MEKAGQRIRAMRQALEWNQKQLAEKVRVDQSTVSDIERGSDFSADLLMRMADALGTSPAMIMKGRDDAVWPFRRIPMERFVALSLEDKAFVEGVLAKALNDLEGLPNAEDLAAFNAAHRAPKKKSAKRKAA